MDKLKHYTLKAMFYHLPKQVREVMLEEFGSSCTDQESKEETLLSDHRAQRFILDQYTADGLLFYMKQVTDCRMDELIYYDEFPWDYDDELKLDWKEFFLSGTDIEPVDITENGWNWITALSSFRHSSTYKETEKKIKQYDYYTT